jgi:two-component system, chemotaxis family, protein-glutamate methylesterase/glutaminase
VESSNIIIIGASTGGPETLQTILTDLPVLDAFVLIVQHMPIYVNKSVRDELAGASKMKVKLAEDGEYLEKGIILLSPSQVHMELRGNRGIVLTNKEKVNFVRPAIDITMKSLKRIPRINPIGVILTGIGLDGAEGITHIKNLGGTTIAQDEATSIIYGMPKAAAATENIDFVLPLPEIAPKIVELVNSGASKKDQPVPAVKK